jgi:formylglycine-generating enzyme required for sulfatase activity
MGSDLGEPGHTAAEGARTTVTVSQPYWLGATPVTHGQWRAVMGGDLSDQARKAFGTSNALIERLGAVEPEVAMYFVDWHEAMDFCARLNERARAAGVLPAGYAFTLPTEAQWEYACRAGTSGAVYGADLDAIAWYSSNSSVNYDGPPWNALALGAKPGNGQAGPRQVGQKQPNAWGLYDMLGNVYQWCRDFAPGSLPGGSVTDPGGAGTGSNRVVRGGSWHSEAERCRAAYRAWSSPDGRSTFIGFRIALAPVPAR